VRQIARRLGRDPSTISRELRRNAATRGGRLDYRASVAPWQAELTARRPKTAKLVANQRLREYVVKTPAEALNDQLLLLQATGVASTS
jgi:transposase, IS30 family